MVDEVKNTNSETPVDGVVELKKEYELENFARECEDERKNVIGIYKKTRRTNNIIMVVVVALFIAAFILLTQGQWGQITGWVIVGVSISGMVVYYIISRKKYPNLSKDYCVHFWEKSNDFLFNQEGFSDCVLDMKEKYELATVAADRVYTNISDIASRNIVHGKYNDKDFVFGELAFYKVGTKRNSKEVMFVGRHISFENKLDINGRLILNLRGEKQLDIPTDIEDLTLLAEKDNMFIYGEDGLDYKKVLGTELISKIKSIKVNDPLLNVSMVFWHKRTAVYMSYDDSIVAIPFNSELMESSYATLKKNIKDMFDILDELSNKKVSVKVTKSNKSEEKVIEEKPVEQVEESPVEEAPVEEKAEE